MIFDDENWVSSAKSRLEKNGGSLQLFDRVFHLPKEVDARYLSRQLCRKCTPIITGVSVAKAIRERVFEENKFKYSQERVSLDCCNGNQENETFNSYGFAWSAIRTIIEKCGHYDRNIIGGSDMIYAFAGLSKLSELWSFRPYTEIQKKDATVWAQRAQSVGLFANMDSLDQKIYHMWHGHIANRNYRGRSDILMRYGFDPTKDIEVAGNGTLRMG